MIYRVRPASFTLFQAAHLGRLPAWQRRSAQKLFAAHRQRPAVQPRIRARPKRKTTRKRGDTGPDPGEAAATAAKKNYAASSAQFEVEPLPLVLTSEEGNSAFLHSRCIRVSHRTQSTCARVHVRAPMHALGEYGSRSGRRLEEVLKMRAARQSRVSSRAIDHGYRST